MKKYLLTILCSIICFSVWSQEENDSIQNSMQIIASPQSNKTFLRWAPSTPLAWVRANKYGYVIERHTLYRNNERLQTPEVAILTPSPIKPEPLENWEEIVDNDDYAAIIAQSLYGESFVVEGTGNNDGIMEIVNKAEELDQRFSFSLFAADMNFEAAKKAGLGLEDNTAKNNERYYYKVKAMIPEEVLVVNPGIVYVDMRNIEELPAPIDVFAVEGDKSVLLTWDYEAFKTVYTSYFVERSNDGNNFTRLGDKPFVNLNNKANTPARRMHYVDTIAHNNKTYYYRVIGVSPFGEEGTPSEVLAAKGVKDLSVVPHISRHDFNKDGSVIISWEFLEKAEAEITGFELNWAVDDAGPYKVVKTNIPPNKRKTTFNELGSSNYFTVSAIGKNNQKTTSFSALVQTVDSIPPAKPLGVIGVIDSLGIVNLKWEPNTDIDILGYRVFRGNIENEEVSQLTIGPIEENTFVDTVQIKSLNSKVYYQIVAVDQRFNMSDYSEKIALKKPDVVPPSSPIFSNYKVNNGVVTLKWINSTSDDLKLHKLFRKSISGKNKEWQLVFETDTISSFVDEKVITNSTYRYAIFAEDESNLMSEPSTPLTITVKNFEAQETLKGVNAFADLTNMNIQLSWRKPSNDVVEVLIYKSKGEDKPTLWKQIPASVNSLVDTKVTISSIYTYHFKPVLLQGGFAAVKTIEVKF